MDSLIAGAMAGLFVDLSLYPIDTIKTRIQAKNGFLSSGGFKNIYKGLSAVAVGSVPGGAAFFLAYDSVKQALLSANGVAMSNNATTEMSGGVFACQALAAACGESTACCVRVPVEMVKQQMQAGHHPSILSAVRHITNNVPAGATTNSAGGRLAVRPSGVPYLFTGMPIMLLREIPFAIIQMSLYETIKYRLNKEETLAPYYYALLPACGAFSGGTAAFLTTPLDVIKTRIMLLPRHQKGSVGVIGDVIRDIVAEPARSGDRFGPTQKFFRGAATRVLWISLGGSIFFGTYEFVKRSLATAPGQRQ